MRLYEFALLGLMTGLAGCGAEAAKAPMVPESPPPKGDVVAVSGGTREMALNEPAKQRNVTVDGVQFSADSSTSPSPAAPPPPPPPPGGQGGQSAPSAKAPATSQAPQNRDFVIYTAQFTMAVYQVDTGIAAIEKIARDHNGYLAAKKDREIIIRVPRAQFEAAVSKVDKVGDVIHRDIAALDVTDEHVDLEIRIKNSRAMQKQLTELLARANVKEALEIEKELGRVTEELERLEGRIKLLNDRIAFSTITVQFEARGQTLQTQRVRLPFPWLNTLNLPTLLNLGEDK